MVFDGSLLSNHQEEEYLFGSDEWDVNGKFVCNKVTNFSLNEKHGSNTMLNLKETDYFLLF